MEGTRRGNIGDLGGDGAAQGLLKWDKCDLFMWLFEMLLLIPPYWGRGWVHLAPHLPAAAHYLA